MFSFAQDKAVVKRICELQLGFFLLVETLEDAATSLLSLTFLTCVSMMANDETLQELVEITLGSLLLRPNVIGAQDSLSFRAVKVLVNDNLIWQILDLLIAFIVRRPIWLAPTQLLIKYVALLMPGQHSLESCFVSEPLFVFWVAGGKHWVFVGIGPFIDKKLLAYLERLENDRGLGEEGRFRANDAVNLPQLFHNSEIVEVDVRRHEVDIPHGEVSVEVDSALHRDFGKVRHVRHESWEREPVLGLQYANSAAVYWVISHQLPSGIESVEREIWKH